MASGLAAGILFVGYVGFEIPSNLILARGEPAVGSLVS